MYRFDKLVQFLVCFFVEFIEVNKLVNNHRNCQEQVNIVPIYQKKSSAAYYDKQHHYSYQYSPFKLFEHTPPVPLMRELRFMLVHYIVKQNQAKDGYFN